MDAEEGEEGEESVEDGRMSMLRWRIGLDNGIISIDFGLST